MLRQRSSLIIYQTLAVDEPDLSPRSLLVQSVQLEVAHQLLRDTHACAARSQEQDTMRLWCGPAGRCGSETCGVEETGEDDGAGALDVIVENRVGLFEAFEVGEGVVGGEVLWLLLRFVSGRD